MKREHIDIEQYMKQAIDLYHKQLCCFASGFVGRDDCEDIVEDIYLMLLERLNDESKPILSIEMGDLKAYLYMCVRNRCLNRIKHNNRKRARHEIIQTCTTEEKQPEVEALSARQILDIIKKEVDENFSTEKRRIFYLIFEEEWSVKKIAEELRITVDTVRTQKYRIMQDMRKLRIRLAV